MHEITGQERETRYTRHGSGHISNFTYDKNLRCTDAEEENRLESHDTLSDQQRFCRPRGTSDFRSNSINSNDLARDQTIYEVDSESSGNELCLLGRSQSQSICKRNGSACSHEGSCGSISRMRCESLEGCDKNKRAPIKEDTKHMLVS